jgi:hypothetical protein
MRRKKKHEHKLRYLPDRETGARKLQCKECGWYRPCGCLTCASERGELR